MTNIEMVEKLREKAQVTYAEAKDALERANWDILDAMILLENEGKVSSQNKAVEGGLVIVKQQEESTPPPHEEGGGFRKSMKKFFTMLGKIIKLGNSNEFLVEKNGDTVVRLPVTAFVLLVMFCFWIIVPLLIVGLFFSFRYSFSGSQLGKDGINDAMHKASNVAESIKDEFKGSAQ